MRDEPPLPAEREFTGERLCRVCHHFRHWQEMVLLPRKHSKRALGNWVCLKCWSERRREVIKLVGQKQVEKFLEEENRESKQSDKGTVRGDGLDSGGAVGLPNFRSKTDS